MQSPVVPPRRALDLGVLDALRGVAALYVVVFHARSWLSWPNQAAVDAGIVHRILNALWDTVLFSHVPVLLFFLISGFCIHYRQAKALASQAPALHSRPWLPLDLGAYAWRRLRRLYPPLLVAIAITAVVDYVGVQINPSYYAGHSPYEPFNTYLTQFSDHSWVTLLGNLAFQANLAFRVFGTNLPLWTLSYEFWFYALYPIALVASTRFGPRRMLAMTGVVSVVGLAFAIHDGTPTGAWIARVLTYWVVWTAGAFVAEAYVGRSQLRGLRVAAPIALVGLGLLAVNFLHPKIQMDALVEDLLWSLGLAILLAWAMIVCPAGIARSVQRTSRWLAPLGNMSYSLYVVHMPWLFLLSAWWLTAHDALPGGVELGVLGVAGAVLLASGSWWLVERHCISHRVRTISEVAAAGRWPSQPAVLG